MRLLAAMLVVLVSGTLFVGAHAVEHRHDGPGIYDASCPLAALGAIDRNSGVVHPTNSTPFAIATSLVALALVGCLASRPAADVRFRAPPTR